VSQHHQADAHVAARWVAVPAARAFAALSDPVRVGRWSLGSLDLVAAGGEPGVHVGRSLLDGSATRVRIVPHAVLGIIDYHVGKDGPLRPRIFARVTDGAAIGGDPGHALVALVALRAPGGDPAAWARTCTLHEAEILLIQAQLETEQAA
jgi:hypothetical protein